ncbi:MAG: FHA domain-containing protein [Bdellovibrionales bacterium]|nr:FHA domain-containing protein [Bdellovibrionales bacterium]
MWGIRILNGPQSGQIFPLKPGVNILGRSPQCDIKVLNPNISKQHTKIEVLENKFIISDMGSRNGTFINGAQVRTARIHPGDRLGLHEVILEVVPMLKNTIPFSNGTQRPPPPPGFSQQYHSQNLAYQMNPFEQNDSPPQGLLDQEGRPQATHPSVKIIQEYVNRVVLPGVYHLATLIEFRWLLGLMMGAFILLVTSLSTIPLIRILRDSVEQQSQQHAVTIASTLAKVNEGPIRDGLYTAINMQTAQRSGVTEALIIQAMDGKILAPASRAEGYPNIPFVHEARKMGKEDVRQVSNNSVVAVHPIEAFNPETGSRGILAYAVVVYDMTSLAVNDSKTISLFIITLFIATVLGGLLFFFLYKLIEFPIQSLNLQLDTALREGRDDLKVDFQFPSLIKLASNINSALSRVLSGGVSTGISQPLEHDRHLEMGHLVEILGFAAMIISAHDRRITAVNQGFEEKTQMNPSQVVGQTVDTISDQALKLSLQDLIQRLEQNPDQLVNNELDFGGHPTQILAQAIFGTAKIAYFVIVLVPGGDG